MTEIKILIVACILEVMLQNKAPNFGDKIRFIGAFVLFLLLSIFFVLEVMGYDV